MALFRKNYTNTELFETMPVRQTVFRMAIPSIAAQLIVLIYNMADTFFIGQINNPYMVAAASLVLPLFNITVPIAGIAGTGGSALVSRLLGLKRPDEAQKTFSFSVIFTVIIAVIFSLVMLALMGPILMVLGAGENTFDFASSYALCIIVFGGLPTIMSNVLSSFVRSVGESGKAGFGIMLGGVINIALDPLFMFVIFPPGNEIMGVGVATCVSNCISCIYFIIIMVRMGKESPLKLVAPRQLPESESIKKIFAIGVPAAITVLLFDVDYMIIGRLMSDYSDIALASIGIVLKVERLPLNVGIGICQGMIPVVAYNFAAKNYGRMREVARFCLMAGVIFAIASITLYEIFAPQIMRLFIQDADTVMYGTDFLRIRSLATILMFSSFYHVYLFNGYSRGAEAMFLGVLRWAGLNIPMLFILNAAVGMYGIPWAQVAGDSITVIVSVIVHRRYVKKNIRDA